MSRLKCHETSFVGGQVKLKINRMNKIITSYFIDDNSTLHTFIGDLKHITFSNVDSIFEAELLIEEENSLNQNN